MRSGTKQIFQELNDNFTNYKLSFRTAGNLLTSLKSDKPLLGIGKLKDFLPHLSHDLIHLLMEEFQCRYCPHIDNLVLEDMDRASLVCAGVKLLLGNTEN